MNIRQASEADIPAIVNLLKVSLGEGLMPKSIEYWEWKHIHNPFGQSPVLVAEIDGRIIGVRAFLRWNWKQQTHMYRAVRAVDTATDPSYQGKGIFSKLTYALLDKCKQDEIDFVYNTPNHKSQPGYLKMGWQVAGKLPLAVSIRRPISIGLNVLRNKATKEFNVKFDDSVDQYLTHGGLSDLLQANSQSASITTVYTPQYLTWRYSLVPVAKYFACAVEESGALSGLLFYRIKQSRLGIELRITDAFIASPSKAKLLREMLFEEARKFNVDFVTSSGFDIPNRVLYNNPLLKFFKGPTVTVREVNRQTTDLMSFTGWSPSLGDLELF
jgi:N-acetylglutamate synthase-like GNAT family acetyltransferase